MMTFITSSLSLLFRRIPAHDQTSVLIFVLFARVRTEHRVYHAIKHCHYFNIARGCASAVHSFLRVHSTASMPCKHRRNSVLTWRLTVAEMNKKYFCLINSSSNWLSPYIYIATLGTYCESTTRNCEQLESNVTRGLNSITLSTAHISYFWIFKCSTNLQRSDTRSSGTKTCRRSPAMLFPPNYYAACKPNKTATSARVLGRRLMAAIFVPAEQLPSYRRLGEVTCIQYSFLSCTTVALKLMKHVKSVQLASCYYVFLYVISNTEYIFDLVT